MVCLLAAVPVRHKAFAGLRIGHSLFIVGKKVTVAIPEELSKLGAPWEADLPSSVG